MAKAQRTTTELQQEADAALSRAEWTVDEAFCYLTRTKGKQADLAAYELQEHATAGRLPVTCRHLVEGTVTSSGIVPADFWRDHLAFAVVNGRAVIRPLRALNPGEYKYFISRDDLLRLYASAPDQADKTNRTYQLIRTVAGKKWPQGYDHVETREIIKRVGDEIKDRNIPVPKRDVFLRALKRRK